GIGTDIVTGPDGNLYVTSLSNGAVYMITNKNLTFGNVEPEDRDLDREDESPGRRGSAAPSSPTMVEGFQAAARPQVNTSAFRAITANDIPLQGDGTSRRIIASPSSRTDSDRVPGAMALRDGTVVAVGVSFDSSGVSNGVILSNSWQDDRHH